ncbi:hypothetical protein ANAEL_03974 [Anaerolineales bacterium]|nr:hypothetical protein ANAEL_03974 [Anaerolineales bacterium]
MKTYNPTKLTLWAALNGTISAARFLGLMQTGKHIAESLEGESTLDKLAQFELGLENMQVTPGKIAGTHLVTLSHCPFGDLTQNIPPWPPEAMRLVANYNRNPTEGGGGALHPLCIVHRGIRENMPDKVLNIACRSESSGAMVISETNLDKAQLTREEVEKMLAGNACVYCIQKAHSQP